MAHTIQVLNNGKNISTTLTYLHSWTNSILSNVGRACQRQVFTVKNVQNLHISDGCLGVIMNHSIHVKFKIQNDIVFKTIDILQVHWNV